jgi:hypothetical protein
MANFFLKEEFTPAHREAMESLTEDYFNQVSK